MTTLPNLLEAVHEITPTDRAKLLGELVKAMAKDKPIRQAEMLRDAVGSPVGLFLPVAHNPPCPPEMTPEERAELQRRLDTIDNAITGEELIARIRRADGVGGAKS